MKCSIVFGTRPEVIKLAPVALQAMKAGHDVKLVFTGQHRDLVLPLLQIFGLKPDIDLDAMVSGQSLAELSTRVLAGLEARRDALGCDTVIVQGDTTSAFLAAYWAFLRRIPVAHVEAGLRTYDLEAPFPEEANRQLIGRLARFHFAPTMQAAISLKNEMIREGVQIVGNTAIDALIYSLGRVRAGDVPADARLSDELREFTISPNILVTAHRRENHGAGMRQICEALLEIVERRKDARIVYPVHPNPNVRKPVQEILGSHHRIKLVEPQGYLAFIELMDRASVLLTDSGGIQEEGPTLRKPIIVMRETTERPEGVTAGFAKLVGTSRTKIVEETLTAFELGCTAQGPNPYGDGRTAERIIQTLSKALDRVERMAS